MKLRARLLRATLRERGGYRLVIISTIKRPVWAVRHALRGYREYGTAAVRAGASPLRQLLVTWWTHLRYLVPADVVYRYVLFDRGGAGASRHYCITGAGMPLVYNVARAVSGAEVANTLADKRRFAAWCEAQGLPSVPTVAEFDAGAVSRSYVAGGELPRTDLFSKWGTSFGGEATNCWCYKDGWYFGRDRQPLSSTELFAQLAAQSRNGVVLLQPRLVNHPAIARLSPRALSTIRVMTTMRPGMPPQFLTAVLRMATGDATADNFAQGGIAAPVDSATGVLGNARGLDDIGWTQLHRTHPDTGVPIVGLQLPCWPESVRLALRAHALLGGVPVVGWDVAVLPGGPVLVEGNWNPCIKLVQVATQTPVLNTEFAACLLEWIGESVRGKGDAWLVAAAA